MKAKKALILAVVLSFVAIANCMAQVTAGEIMQDIKNFIWSTDEKVAKFVRPVKEGLKEKRLDVDFFAGMSQGFDNNVNLDPERRKDGFFEVTLGADLGYAYSDDLRLMSDSMITELLYYNANESNFLDLSNKTTIELDIWDDAAALGGSYAFNTAFFPVDKDASYTAHKIGTYLKTGNYDPFYHKLKYDFSYKNYHKYRTRRHSGIKSETEVGIVNNSVGHEGGWLLFDMVLLKNLTEFGRSSSNYYFMHYYDYWFFKLKPSIVLFATDELSLTSSFQYTKKDYDDRTSSEDDEHVYDDNYRLNFGLIYRITKSCSLSGNYSYRDNRSNEPLQKYAGSVWTLGVYYTF